MIFQEYPILLSIVFVVAFGLWNWSKSPTPSIPPKLMAPLNIAAGIALVAVFNLANGLDLAEAMQKAIVYGGVGGAGASGLYSSGLKNLFVHKHRTNNKNCPKCGQTLPEGKK